MMIRNRRDGDRLQPKGLNGSKKVKDMFIDAKVPLTQRDRLPLLFYHNECIWIPGIRQASHGRVTEHTTEYVTFIAEPLAEEDRNGHGHRTNFNYRRAAREQD